MAAFGGTMGALMCCVVACVGAVFAIMLSNDGFNPPSNSLTYRNDTDRSAWVYECADRCDEVLWSFPLQPEEWVSYGLSWYDEYPVDWVVVTHEDSSYGCINLEEWTERTVPISSASSCPSDIHSPENEVT